MASLTQQDEPGPFIGGALGRDCRAFPLSLVSGEEVEDQGGKRKTRQNSDQCFCKVWSVAGSLLHMNRLLLTMQSAESETFQVTLMSPQV